MINPTYNSTISKKQHRTCLKSLYLYTSDVMLRNNLIVQMV